ncbi:hypothetical protein B296_00052340 [Ensete ventricosum]|uniref:Uncharacterized protein n=1 Tax=Ensete ventricosum TaxID=4639 RepID=A0A426X959_ENSVE|nr:hypothetical protein B296_00052340 [Ensete ventricosum]
MPTGAMADKVACFPCRNIGCTPDDRAPRFRAAAAATRRRSLCCWSRRRITQRPPRLQLQRSNLEMELVLRRTESTPRWHRSHQTRCFSGSCCRPRSDTRDRAVVVEEEEKKAAWGLTVMMPPPTRSPLQPRRPPKPRRHHLPCDITFLRRSSSFTTLMQD